MISPFGVTARKTFWRVRRYRLLSSLTCSFFSFLLMCDFSSVKNTTNQRAGLGHNSSDQVARLGRRARFGRKIKAYALRSANGMLL
jgi:hypothetical protein